MPEILFFEVFCYYDPFKVVFRVNCHRKSCSPWCAEYFEKKILSCDVTFLTYDVFFWPKKTSFLQFSTKMSCLRPFEVIFRQNCRIKNCFPRRVEYFEKNFLSSCDIFLLTCYVILVPKTRFFGIFWVYTLLNSFQTKLSEKKLLPLMCWVFKRTLSWEVSFSTYDVIFWPKKTLISLT